MKHKVIFIHGMFQNATSWDSWVDYFTEKGYDCLAESWPLHVGDPKQLRENPPLGLGDLRLQEVIDQFAGLVSIVDPEAILIGHSVGGLIVQAILNKGLGSMGVCISSAAPNKMLAFDWGFFKNSLSIVNPLKGDEPFWMTPEIFHQSFCNTMTREESDEAYERTAVHDSRQVFRDCLMEAGELDLDQTNRPLFFISGENDEIIPAELNKKNAKAYKNGLAEFAQFPNRGHFICGQPGWRAVAETADRWVNRQYIHTVQV
ncbi:MAG TPA: alpha/beta hydrolase [Cytophagaceae bacterium]|jgi:pimeloyl-ACP methyl ester carboxylesterase|nr:alpha/beta hydrolase [Cytophagaceae bacterium]